MCAGKDIQCAVKVTELKEGYQVQITGGKVKEVLNPANLKRCIEACCAGVVPFKEMCCH